MAAMTAAHTPDPRRMWHLFEPIHAVTYFAPQCRAAYEAAGLRGFWRGYFAGRAAPMGAVGDAAVYATFFGFARPMVSRALPHIWQLATPEAALQARRDGARAALTALLDGEESTAPEAAALLRAAAERVVTDGRVLGAANAALPWPDEPLDVLWQAATVLREHRGDGHVAALVTAGVDGVESLVWHAATRANGRYLLQPARGWSDEEWDAARERLQRRGWLDSAGALTAAGRQAREDVETITDRLAAAPWQELGEARTRRCAELLGPLAARAATVLPSPNPIGVPVEPAAGPAGAAGAAGPAGAADAGGPAGAAGPADAAGPAGPAGPPGSAGA